MYLNKCFKQWWTKVDTSDAEIETIKVTFLSSKIVVQMVTGHVFFHLNTAAHHIASVLQPSLTPSISGINGINHGALLRLMLMEIMLEACGNPVTVTVEKVITVLIY